MPVVTTYTATSNFTLNHVASPPPAGNALATAAAALVPGSGATSYANYNPAGLSLMASTDIIDWLTRWHWDPTNLRGWMMCKRAEDGNLPPFKLFKYDAATDTITKEFDSRTLPTGSGTGHGYDSACLDPATGDFYYTPYLGSFVCRWTGSAWVQASGAVTNSGGSESDGPYHFSWHPNLYGSGNGGIVEIRNSNARAWRKSSGVTNFAAIGALPYSAIRCAQGVYCSALDAVITSCGTAGLAAIRVDGGTTPVATRLPYDLPVPCTSNATSSDANMSRMVQTPTGSVAIFESSAASRVWRLNASNFQWELQSYSHPLRLNGASSPSSWPTMYVSTYGIYWAIREVNGGNSTPNSLLWRPPATL